jgi:histidine ammonia-lyase
MAIRLLVFMQTTTEALPTDENTLELTGASLTVEDVVAVARTDVRVRVSEEALQRVREARTVVERVLAQGTPIYGVNTGLGSLSRHHIPLEELERFAFATVADQTASYGEPVATDIVRAMMVARANGMAKAGVGVRREVVLQLVGMLNARVHPVVRRLGSVGQGDLSEMSDIGKVMIGRGLAEVGGRILPGGEALAAAGLEPIRPAPKEALALVSANGVTLGHGSLVLVDAADLTESFQIAAALSLEGFAGNLSPIHPAAARMRPHAGEIKASGRLRELLAGSHLWEPGAARNLQDPLSFRCVPQTHGALNDALYFARGEMDVELNSASDNPLVVVEDEAIISVGNFDVLALAIAFDLLRLGLASALKVADERVQKLLWNSFSGLPSGLTPEEGPTGGLRPLGRWCAALAAEGRHLANPVSLAYGAQVAEGVEDHASMAPLAVRKASELVSLGHQMVAHELICAAQAVDLRGFGPLGQGTRVAYECVRECVPRLVDETDWEPEVARLVELIASGELAARVAAGAGEREPLEAHEGPRVADTEDRGGVAAT